MINEPNPADEIEAVNCGQDDLLVAYLDGELDPQQTVDVERKLADDVVLRRRLHELQASWDVLDCLPQTLTAETFTKSTIELVTREATRELQRTRRHKQSTWLRRGALAVLAIGAAWGGFQTVRTFQTASQRQLARDLRVIENMDLYRSIDSLEFLKQLEQAGLFVSEESDSE